MARTTEPLSTRLYQELRRRIIAGDYPQGMRLHEQRIAEEFKVSRIPLREAIPRLEAEGFVQSTPRLGIAVTRWTVKAVDDLFDVRLALEGRAARLAAQRVAAGASSKDLQRAFIATEDVLHGDDCRCDGDALALAMVNAHFHEAIVGMAGNALLSSLMAAVAGRMTWLFYLTSQRDVHVACAEHGAITNAIADGNALLAESLVVAHIEAGRRPSLALLAGIFDAE